MKYIVFIVIFITQISFASPLERYIAKALESNLALKQQNFSYEKSQYALKEARGMFLPNVSIHARYSRAGGGREIEFPVGDLMNPVYRSLNQILTQLSQPAPFPENLPNETIPFLREKEHETKIRLVQPLLQPKIWYNYSIKSLMEKSEFEKKKMFMRQLVADVKIAWYRYLQSAEVVNLYKETEKVLQENLRVSQKLVENDKATKDVVYTARAELSELQQQLKDAGKNKKLATQYLNFLCNQPLDQDIETSGSILSNIPIPSAEDANAAVLKNREELKLLNLAVSMADNGINIAQSDYFPTVNAVVDYGFQGEEYNFTSQDDYWMASAIVEWNLFNGWQDEAKSQQARIQKKILETQKAELEKKLILQVSEAFEQTKVAKLQCIAAQETQKSAQEAFRIISKKYKQNTASQIEYIAARNRVTRANISNIICRYSLAIHETELEKVVAVFPIDDYIKKEEN